MTDFHRPSTVAELNEERHTHSFPVWLLEMAKWPGANDETVNVQRLEAFIPLHWLGRYGRPKPRDIKVKTSPWDAKTIDAYCTLVGITPPWRLKQAESEDASHGQPVAPLEEVSPRSLPTWHAFARTFAKYVAVSKGGLQGKDGELDLAGIARLVAPDADGIGDETVRAYLGYAFGRKAPRK